jgi:hypothetical protein
MTPQSGGKASELVNRVQMHMLQSLAGLVSKYSRKLIRVSTLPSIVTTEGGEWRDNDAWHTREACWLAWYDIRSKGCRQGSSWWRQRCEGAFSAPQGSWRQWRRQWRQHAAMMSGKPNDSGGTQYSADDSSLRDVLWIPASPSSGGNYLYVPRRAMVSISNLWCATGGRRGKLRC